MKNIKKDIIKTFCNIISDIIGEKIKEENIDLNTPISKTYDKYYLDSLDIVEIIIQLEKHYNISIPDIEVSGYADRTLNDFFDLVVKYKKQNEQKKSLFYRIKQHFQRIK